ncbi:thioesterase family protein [Bradyrhizobium arachidis]|uniref:thioesterase family protein n=2 Tax=Nitrobacteraceae TaxID=41294 RepID=UPI00042A7C4F|nr:thioesterase family protein [Bradyrhizobium arachidis]UFW51291.1 thioesterase family protein [Bradyrhizobium arachidis]
MFDRAIDELWLGIGSGYTREWHGWTFTGECHVCYLREINQGTPITATLVVPDEKRWIRLRRCTHHGEG